MEADQFIQCDNNIDGASSLIDINGSVGGASRKGIYSQKQQMRKKKDWREKIMSFYYKEFDKITKKYTRGKIVSFVIFSVFQLQQISLLYNSQVQDLISSHSNQNIPYQLYQIISYVRIEPLIQDLINLNNIGSNLDFANLSKYITLIFFLFFSLLFFVHIFIRLLVYVIEMEDDTAEVQYKALHRNKESKFSFLGGGKSFLSVHMLQENVNLVFDTIASFYYQCILFVFFIPSTQIFSEIYNDQISNFGFVLAAIGFLNMILHLIIVIIYTLHDYDYEISYSDHLSKRDSLWGFFHIISVGSMAAFYNTTWGLGISTIHWVLKCFEMIELFIEFPYYDELIRYWNCLFVFLHFTFSFIAYLFMFVDLRGNCNISMIYLIIAPISCQIGDFVFSKMEKRVKELYKHSKNPSHIDQYIRYLNTLYDLEYNKYTQLKYGVDFESIYTDHIIQCSDFKCFCSEYQYKPFKWENFIQSDDRSFFLQNYIVKLLEGQTILQSNRKDHATNRLRFTYLQFLIEKVPNPTKAFTQIISNLNHKNIISLKEYYVLHKIMRRCQKSYRSFFIDSTYQNQRLPMMTIISFDYLLENSINIFKELLYEIRQFYNFLCQDLIDVNNLYTIGQRLVMKRHLLEQNVKLLFDINPRSDVLYGLAEGYTQLLDLKSRRVKQFKKKSLDLLHSNRLKQDLEINLTSKNSCVIYISLQASGQIKKVTHSFQTLFGLPMKNMVGKSIEAIMPDVFSENHDKYINKFVEKGNMENMNKSRSNLFGKNALGFIFPINLRIRLNYIGYEDFGVCGQISKVQDNFSEFIMLDKDLNISDISRKFYKATFENLFEDEKKRCKKINLTRILPLMGSYIEENYFNKESFIESTMMVIPSSNRQISFFKKRNHTKKEHMQKYIKELSPTRFTYFEVSLQLIILKSSYGNIYRSIEIKKMKKLKRITAKQELIHEFVEEYNKNFSANINYNEVNNSSSRYLETGTVIDQSYMNNSSISGSSSRQQSIKKKKQKNPKNELTNSIRQNGDIFSNFKQTKTVGEFSITSMNKLFTTPLKFETIIGVRRLIKKFVRNMYQAINKRRSSRNILMHQNDFYMPNPKLEKYNSVDTSEYQSQVQPQDAYQSDNKRNQISLQKVVISKQDSNQSILNTPSQIQLQKSTSINYFPQKKEIPNGKLAHKKSSFLLKSYQQIDNQGNYQYVLDERDEANMSSNFPDLTSARPQQSAHIAESTDHYPYFGVLNSPTPSDMPLNPYSNGVFEFSGRYEYQNGLFDQNLNSMDQYFSSDVQNEYQRNEGKESVNSTQIQNNEDHEMFSPSTKNPSSYNQNAQNNKKVGYQNNEKPLLSIQSPRTYQRDFSSTLVPEDGTQIASANYIVQQKQDIGSTDFNKQQTVSLIETNAPHKTGKFNMKKYSSNFLHLVKESKQESSKAMKNRQSLDIFEEDQQENDDDQSETKKTKHRRGTETIFEGDNKRKIKEINDQQSVNSAMSQTYSKKIHVIESITTSSKPLLIISISGIAAFLFMVTVTSGIFIYLNTIFKDNVSDFNNLLVGTSLQSDYAYIMKEKEVLNLISINQLTTLSQSKADIQTNSNKLVESFKQGTILLFNQRSSVGFSVRVNNEYIIVDYYLLPQRNQIQNYNDYQYPMRFLINYSTIVLYTHLSFYVTPQRLFINSLRYVDQNIITYFNEFQTIQTITREESLSEVTNMEKNIIVTIAIMEGVAFFVLVIGIPIYAKIQQSRESWLKLFATWPQSKLQEIIKNIDLYITEEYGTLKQLERANNSKRKTVSSVTVLKKFNGILFFYIFLCLVLVSIYPIINLIFTQDFVKEFNYSIQEINSIQITKALTNSEFAISLQVARKMYEGMKVEPEILQYYIQIHDDNTQNIQELYQMQKDFSSTRYQQDTYLNFLLTAFNTNVCDPLNSNSQYYPHNSNKGIIATLKEIQNQFQNLQEIVLTSTSFNADFEIWVKESNLNELFEVQRQLSDYLTTIQIFLMQMIEDYKNYITTIQFWLYLYSLFVLIAIFLIGFSFFVKRLADSLQQTRYLMTLFKVDYILENSYIMSFLSDEISKGRLK